MNADALLAEVLAHPDDDAPRLVYADWLLERGEAQRDRDRGEFIHLSCALAKLDDAPAAVRVPKVRRAMELLGQWEPQWVDAMLEPSRRPGQNLGVEWSWSRGFIERYRLGAGNDDFRPGSGLARLWRRTPVRDLRIVLSGGSAVQAFLAEPWLSTLHSLTVEFKALADVVNAFFGTRALQQLRHLSVRFTEQRQVHLLAKHAAAFTALESLELHFPEQRLEASTFQVIAELSFGSRLKHFGWGPSSGVDEVLALPFALESLAFHSEVAEKPPLRQLLGRPRAFPSLRKLQLAGRWTFEELDRLVAARGGFTALRLHHASSDAPGFAPMIQRPSLESLETLSITRAMSFGDEEAEALAAATHLTRLRELELSGLQLSSRGAQSLLGAPHLGRLRRLSLRQNVRLGAVPFATAQGFDELELLDLRDNGIPARGAGADRLRKRFGAAARVGPWSPALD